MYKTMLQSATLLNGNAATMALRINLCKLTQCTIKENGKIDEINAYYNQNST